MFPIPSAQARETRARAALPPHRLSELPRASASSCAHLILEALRYKTLVIPSALPPSLQPPRHRRQPGHADPPSPVRPLFCFACFWQASKPHPATTPPPPFSPMADTEAAPAAPAPEPQAGAALAAGEAAAEDDGAEVGTFASKVSLTEVKVESGEDNEDILFKMRAKIYKWTKADEKYGGQMEWKEKGVGELSGRRTLAVGVAREGSPGGGRVQLCAVARAVRIPTSC